MIRRAGQIESRLGHLHGKGVDIPADQQRLRPALVRRQQERPAATGGVQHRPRILHVDGRDQCARHRRAG